MRYSEFKKRTEKLGFQVYVNTFGGTEVYNKDDRLVAIIDDGYQLRTNLRGSILWEFEQPNGKRLFETMIEYAKTPVADRQDET